MCDWRNRHAQMRSRGMWWNSQVIGEATVTEILLVSESVRKCHPLDPLFKPSDSVFKCQTYSCWVLLFRFEPHSLGNIREIFISSHSLWVLLWKFDIRLGQKFAPRILRLGWNFTPRILRLEWKFTPRNPHPYPFSGELRTRWISQQIHSTANQ